MTIKFNKKVYYKINFHLNESNLDIIELIIKDESDIRQKLVNFLLILFFKLMNSLRSHIIDEISIKKSLCTPESTISLAFLNVERSFPASP